MNTGVPQPPRLGAACDELVVRELGDSGGVLVPPPYAENLARTLDSFLDDPERLTRLSAASARVAAAHA